MRGWAAVVSHQEEAEHGRQVRRELGSWKVDEQAAAKAVAREFPGVTAWFGRATGRWWAVVPVLGDARLVEATDPVQLRDVIANVEAWPWPPR